MRRPFDVARRSSQSSRSSWYGRLMRVARSRACDSTAISSAASATRARHRPGDAAGIRRIDRDAAQAGLQREDAAPAGRQAHRAADVGADVQRPVARRRGRARAGAASRRGSCSGPTGCASAGESSTGPTTACRSRASWSWPRSTAPASRTRAAGGASSGGRRQLGRRGAQRHRARRAVAMFSLIVHRHAVERRQRRALAASAPRWRAPAASARSGSSA